MDYKYIIQLLERYWSCETTLEEETILRVFFSQPQVPAELAQYKSLFAYGEEMKKECQLGDDFDAKMLELAGEAPTVKARIVPIRQRLAPLFKAAAMVAVILTLGNASQKAFDQTGTDADMTSVAQTPAVQQGPSVAMSDSVKTDSAKVITALPEMMK